MEEQTLKSLQKGLSLLVRLFLLIGADPAMAVLAIVIIREER